jgi:hypothetical protein
MPKGSNAERGKEGFQISTSTPTVPTAAPASQVILNAFDMNAKEGLTPWERTYQLFQANRKAVQAIWVDREIDNVNRLIEQAEGNRDYEDLADYVLGTSHPDYEVNAQSIRGALGIQDYEDIIGEARYIASLMDKSDGIEYPNGETPHRWNYDPYAPLKALRTMDDPTVLNVVIASGQLRYVEQLKRNPHLTRDQIERILDNPAFAGEMYPLLLNTQLAPEYIKKWVLKCDKIYILERIGEKDEYASLGEEICSIALAYSQELKRKKALS